MRFECRDGTTVTLTGKVLLFDENEPMKGRVLEGRKIFSRQFSLTMYRFVAKVIHSIQQNDIMRTCEEYVNGRK